MPVELLIRKFFKYNFFVKKIVMSSSIQIFLKVNHVFSGYLNYFLVIVKSFFLFKSIIDLVGVDNLNLNQELRFTLYYNLLNINFNSRCFIGVNIGENTVYQTSSNFINSGTRVFAGLDWLERETWDLLGIFFFNHPDLRRILTDYGFEGFPLRKDFPLTGFLELRYDEEQKSILYEDVELSQEFRFFDFESPWKK